MVDSARRDTLQDISPKTRDEIQAHVIVRTTHGVSKDDILLAICRTHGLSWPQAEVLVDEILAESSKEVNLRRNALSGGIAFFTFLGGGLLAVDSGYRIVRQLTQYPFVTSGVDWDLILTVITENSPSLQACCFLPY